MKAQLRRQTTGFFFPPPSLVTNAPNIVLEVSPVGDYFELLDPEWFKYNPDCPENKSFARLEKGFCNEARLLVCFGVMFRACIDPKFWENFRKTWNTYSTKNEITTFSVDVNVYCLRHHADKVGAILLRAGIFLQRPIHKIGNESYYNPQILQFDGIQQTLEPEEMMSRPEETPTPPVVVDIPVRRDRNQSTDSPDNVECILNSLSHTGILHKICTDFNRIKSQLQG